MAAVSGRTWAQDCVVEAAYVVVLFTLLWRSADDFAVCDGATLFGTAKSDAELQAQVSSGHGWGEQCTPQSTLDNAGLTRAISSGCLRTASDRYLSNVLAVLISCTLCVAGASIHDLVMWRSIEGGAEQKNCRTYATTPMTLIGAILTVVFSIIFIVQCCQGWTCKTDDDAAWIFVTVGGGLSVAKMLLLLPLLFFRIGPLMVNTLYSIADGQARFLLHRPAWTKPQVQGAYGSPMGEQESLIARKSDDGGRVQNSVRPWLEDFYRRHNQEKIGTVEAILSSYVGHEEQLFQELHDKYDLPTKPVIQPAGSTEQAEV